jgi:hypothetical protein
MKTIFYAVLLSFCVLMIACNDDDASGNTDSINYAMTVTAGTYPNQTAYVSGTHDFPTGTVGTSEAAELTGNGMMFRHGKAVYVATFGEPATLRKFTFEDGMPSESGSITVLGLKTFGAVEFVNDTEAYAAATGFGGVPKLVKFNPTTMQITTTVNLTGLEKEGATEVYYLGMVIRDNYLYMGVNYQNADFENLEDKVFVAVINCTTSTVEKLIEDDRSSQMWNGGTASAFSPNTLVKDAANDIYVIGYANNGKPSGVLKINNGETEFDEDYFFNLNNATGKPCLGLFHFDNGMTFTVAYADAQAYPFDTDAEYNSLAAGEIYRINLASKTSLGNIDATLPKILGSGMFMTKWDGDKIYFSVPTTTASPIYSYDVASGEVEKSFDLETGKCNGFTKLD